MEKFNRLKETNYITIPAILRIRYNLNCNEMLIASIIHGFSQDGKSVFSGTLSYLQEWTGLTKQGIIKILNKLIEIGLIEKETEIKNNIKFCYYRSKLNSGKLSLTVVNSVEQGGKLSLMGGGKLSLTDDNISIDNKDKDNNKPTNVGMSQSDPVNQAVDYEKLKTCFNDELSKQNAIIPKLASVTDKRKHAINARVKENGKEALLKVIKKAAASAFLNGRNNRSFIASFDWLMKPNNFIKVLEGNYDENINMNYGNNRSDYEREQRARDAVEIVERLFAADDAERQAATDAGV